MELLGLLQFQGLELVSLRRGASKLLAPLDQVLLLVQRRTLIGCGLADNDVSISFIATFKTKVVAILLSPSFFVLDKGGSLVRNVSVNALAMHCATHHHKRLPEDSLLVLSSDRHRRQLFHIDEHVVLHGGPSFQLLPALGLAGETGKPLAAFLRHLHLICGRVWSWCHCVEGARMFGYRCAY